MIRVVPQLCMHTVAYCLIFFIDSTGSCLYYFIVSRVITKLARKNCNPYSGCGHMSQSNFARYVHQQKHAAHSAKVFAWNGLHQWSQRSTNACPHALLCVKPDGRRGSCMRSGFHHGIAVRCANTVLIMFDWFIRRTGWQLNWRRLFFGFFCMLVQVFFCRQAISN